MRFEVSAHPHPSRNWKPWLKPVGRGAGEETEARGWGAGGLRAGGGGKGRWKLLGASLANSEPRAGLG